LVLRGPHRLAVIKLNRVLMSAQNNVVKKMVVPQPTLPADLGTVKAKLEAGAYASPKEVWRDLRRGAVQVECSWTHIA
jgi:hypothetical protein